MKKTKLYRCLISILAVLTLTTSIISGTAGASAELTKKQETAHQIAELARSIDLPESNPIIIEAERLWQEDNSANPEDTTPLYTSDDAVIIAKIMYSESGGIASDTEKACIAWVILNRFDAGYADSIAKVALAPAQFAYRSKAPVLDNLLELSNDVLSRWEREKKGETDVGRVLPSDYMWYTGDGKHNYFRNAYSGGKRWDYSLESPYSS